MTEYSKYIHSLNKEELVDLILGDENSIPALTRKEPNFNRPQLIWAINKIDRFDSIDFDDKEYIAESLINKMLGHKWDKFYNYDYIRFDIKKPSLYWVLIILMLSIIGITYSSIIVAQFILSFV